MYYKIIDEDGFPWSGELSKENAENDSLDKNSRFQ